ncbi:DnaB-like helicase C-terminal domain-containing protein [Helicobacter sp. 13S00477-4]|uniref:DnaB-like helicase C-terminal domain-containing protein n=1 Tax=Helicobacter sp. 13S00477-4 TaxID=1905759 RepID=UPI000BA5FA42|nr:DnaB-like helicase C-terminal domain-containing protein [Helicobacter sp. 13S00477-4]PAF51976.1 hypothetical protein BKH44_04770 [Helicobacter sp. 13S00477-4]
MRQIQIQILASLLYYSDRIEEFAYHIKPHHFTKELGIVYQTILDLHNKDKPLNIDLLSVYIKDKNLLLELSEAIPTPEFMSYIPELEHSYKISMQKYISAVLLKDSNEGIITDPVVLASKLNDSPKIIKNLSDWASFYENQPNLPRYKTNISFLDFALGGGFEPAQLVLLSGEPEAGKTSLGLQILENIAANNKACFFCFEFTARQYIARKLETNKKFIETSGNNLYIINDGYDISQVADNIKHLSKMGVKFFLIDSQMRLEVPKSRSMEEEESAKFATLAKLAHKLEILIILIIQTAKSDSNSPLGSKKGGHESSITIRIEHCKPNKEEATSLNKEFDPKRRTIIIKKNKQTGKHFKEEVQFDPIRLTFKRDDIRTREKELMTIDI